MRGGYGTEEQHARTFLESDSGEESGYNLRDKKGDGKPEHGMAKSPAPSHAPVLQQPQHSAWPGRRTSRL